MNIDNINNGSNNQLNGNLGVNTPGMNSNIMNNTNTLDGAVPAGSNSDTLVATPIPNSGNIINNTSGINDNLIPGMIVSPTNEAVNSSPMTAASTMIPTPIPGAENVINNATDINNNLIPGMVVSSTTETINNTPMNNSSTISPTPVPNIDNNSTIDGNNLMPGIISNTIVDGGGSLANNSNLVMSTPNVENSGGINTVIPSDSNATISEANNADGSMMTTSALDAGINPNNINEVNNNSVSNVNSNSDVSSINDNLSFELPNNDNNNSNNAATITETISLDQPVAEKKQENQSDNSIAVVSVGKYLGYLFLFCIPLIGLIALLRKIFDKKDKNISNLAKAYLIVFALVLVILGVVIYLLYPSFNEYLQS